MNPASYFDDPLQAQKLHKEAISWLGTPFAECPFLPGKRCDLKGMGGGIDCIGLAQEIFSRIGATEEFVFPRSAADYQSNQLGQKVLTWLRGGADTPESKRLREILVELQIPSAVTDPVADTPRDFFKPGDILVMRKKGLFHMPVIYDEGLHFVNALPRRGVIEGTVQDSSYSVHLVAAFRLKPRRT
jgi:cell wall-associated NlpC family hydrolase